MLSIWGHVTQLAMFIFIKIICIISKTISKILDCFIYVLQNEKKGTVWREIAKSIQWYFKWASLLSRSSSFRTYIAIWKSTRFMHIFLSRRYLFNYVRFVRIRIPKGCIFLRGNRIKIFVISYLNKISKSLLSWKTGDVRFFDYIISITSSSLSMTSSSSSSSSSSLSSDDDDDSSGAITTTGWLLSSSNSYQMREKWLRYRKCIYSCNCW